MAYLCTVNVLAATTLGGYVPGTYNPYRVLVIPPKELLDLVFPLFENNLRTVREVGCALCPENLSR